MRWGPPEGQRLDAARGQARLTQQALSKATGVPIATLQRILAGTSDPGDDRLAALCAAVSVPVSRVLAGDEDDSPFDLVDVYDVDVAAGPGRTPFGEETIGTWPFPRDWLGRYATPGARLAMVRVAGDSQEPDLRDGDLVVIDLTETRLRDGLAVVRLDDRLMLKRVAVEGAMVRLKSANPQYDDLVIDMTEEDQRLTVIARAKATVKGL